jgi:hypothetical protein
MIWRVVRAYGGASSLIGISTTMMMPTMAALLGRNAATLNAIDVSKLLPNGILRKKSESHPADEDCKYYLLSGGWYPFRKTYNDIFLLRISSE